MCIRDRLRRLAVPLPSQLRPLNPAWRVSYHVGLMLEMRDTIEHSQDCSEAVQSARQFSLLMKI
eukprot:12390032-Alexandrium_andersonii.AAC.1